MRTHIPPSSFPDALQIRTERGSLRYTKQPGFYAVHGPLPNNLQTAVELVLEDNTITICRGEPALSADLPTSLKITPVYALDPHGPLAIPTGQIFLRFTPDIRVEVHRRSLAEQGYTVVTIPSYAPHTAWVQATNDDIATSLFNLERLTTLPGVVHAEPQLLMQRKNR